MQSCFAIEMFDSGNFRLRDRFAINRTPANRNRNSNQPDDGENHHQLDQREPALLLRFVSFRAVEGLKDHRSCLQFDLDRRW